MPDPIQVHCPSCSAVYTVALVDLGREAICHECGATFTARRWNRACWLIAGAVALGLLYTVSVWQADRDPIRRHRPAGGFYLAVGVPGAEGVVAVGR